MSAAEPVFFIFSNTRRLFGNFPTADFHEIWPQHVNPCPLETYRKGFVTRTYRKQIARQLRTQCAVPVVLYG